MNKIIAGISMSLVLFSCQSEEQKTTVRKEGTLDFNREWVRLDSIKMGMSKKVWRSDAVEKKQSKSPNWAVELKPFVDADFNRPGVVEKYSRTILESPLSGWKDVVWVANDPKQTTRWAVYRYKDDVCIGASILVDKESDAYRMSEQLTYMPQYGYVIENEQDLNYMDNEQFFLESEFDGKNQPWRMFFNIGTQSVPVNFDLRTTSSSLELLFYQGKETIAVKAIPTDSGYYAEMPIFQSYLRFEKEENVIKGTFHNLDKGLDYIIPFEASKLSVSHRLNYDPTEDYANLGGKWEVHFGEGEDAYAAIGLFDRLGNDLIGTFATETGDYRFLQGKIVGDSFSLSTFDGSHLFLFMGKMNGDEITNGHFYSGTHYTNTWTAKKNDQFELTDPNSMTSLKGDENKINFTFPDLNNNPTSLSDERYQNKVVIIQILGSWCPNCMDETRYFVELYDKYHDQGLEIIGLSFERSNEFKEAKKSLSKAISGLNVPYKMLIAGTPRESGKALPMLTEILSYPTSIVLDRNGNVVKIHTGFYGPGTGEYYEKYTQETETLLEKLLTSK
ncbi:TlpA family protein disulfide reductase [bacterium SCSIO 12643]|nr:TlpA family protein disulfide reductase [bacterium SCSIO 12643]